MNHARPRAGQEKRLVISIGLNFLIMTAELIGGIVSGSLALISDALHNLSDAFSLIVSFIALRLSRLEKTEQRTFGFQRAEVLAALLNASLLIAISFYLFKEAWTRFFNPAPIDGALMIAVAFIGLAANLFAVLLLKRDARENMNIHSAYVHLFADTLSSVAVLAGGIVIYFFGVYWLDPALTIIIGAYVLKEGYAIVNESVRILMHAVPKCVNLKQVQKEIEQIPGIKNIHHLHVWCITGSNIHLEAHVNLVRDLKISETCALKETIESILREKFFVTHPTLQFEYDSCRNVPLVNP